MNILKASGLQKVCYKLPSCDPNQNYDLTVIPNTPAIQTTRDSLSLVVGPHVVTISRQHEHLLLEILQQHVWRNSYRSLQQALKWVNSALGYHEEWINHGSNQRDLDRALTEAIAELQAVHARLHEDDYWTD